MVIKLAIMVYNSKDIRTAYEIAGKGEPVAILNRNTPAFYCVPADLYETMMEQLEDLELNKIADARANQKRVRVNIDDL